MNKPEWFELAEKDGGKTHFEVKRGFRSIALAIPLLAIGAGVVVAQSSDESPANAETATVTTSPVAEQITSSPTQDSKSSMAQMPSASFGIDNDENKNEGD